MAKHKFNHKAKSFSRINLAFLAYCSKLAYRTKEEIRAELSGLGFDLKGNNFFFSSSETDTQCFVTGDRKKIVIAFRGTEGKLEDWATNVQVFKETWTELNPLGEVHNGFYEALTSVWSDIEEEINTLRTENQSIWLTGHSLGGALATLAASTLKFQGSRIDFNGLYTFGQPRLADHRFSKTFNDSLKKKCFRMVNNNEYKRRQAPPGIKITTRAFGNERRYPITSKFDKTRSSFEDFL